MLVTSFSIGLAFGLGPNLFSTLFSAVEHPVSNSRTAPQFNCRGSSSVMASFVASNTDPELSQWLRWASEGGRTPMFARTVVEAARMACLPDYAQLRSA